MGRIILGRVVEDSIYLCSVSSVLIRQYIFAMSIAYINMIYNRRYSARAFRNIVTILLHKAGKI